MTTHMTTTTQPSGNSRPVPGAPTECKECGSTSLYWFTNVRIKNNVVQGRLNTHDMECVFVLGCEECSETLHIQSADAIAQLLAAGLSEEPAPLSAANEGLHAIARELDRLSLVIESAVRQDDPKNSPAVLALIKANQAALAELPYPAGHDHPPSFQSGVTTWMGRCFQPSLYTSMTERGDRLLEEVLETLQAHGYDQSRVPTLVAYVYGRPVGDPEQEVGGVMVTLAAYCAVAGLDMHGAGDAELARINLPEVMARIRAKQEAKNTLHFDTPLPGDTGAAAQLVDQ